MWWWGFVILCCIFYFFLVAFFILCNILPRAIMKCCILRHGKPKTIARFFIWAKSKFIWLLFDDELCSAITQTDAFVFRVWGRFHFFRLLVVDQLILAFLVELKSYQKVIFFGAKFELCFLLSLRHKTGALCKYYGAIFAKLHFGHFIVAKFTLTRALGRLLVFYFNALLKRSVVFMTLLLLVIFVDNCFAYAPCNFSADIKIACIELERCLSMLFVMLFKTRSCCEFRLLIGAESVRQEAFMPECDSRQHLDILCTAFSR